MLQNLSPAYETSINSLFRSMDIVVQPAVSWMELNDQIKGSGLFFPVDPGPSVSAPLILSYSQHFESSSTYFSPLNLSKVVLL
jgi:hypothetical protein